MVAALIGAGRAVGAAAPSASAAANSYCMLSI